MRIGPQPGPQERFLSSKADIAIFGGAAGGGKTTGLLLEGSRHYRNKDFAALFFRRNATQIMSPGGLWAESLKLYPILGGRPRTNPHCQWIFRSGAEIQMRHLQYEADVLAYQGAQIPLLLWDELTHFTKYQFFYMLSRNRTTCGVRPYVRGTCNPDPDSWVAQFIAWWIDPETGLPIPARDGVLRYFTTVNDEQVWGNTPEECAGLAGVGPEMVKSVTFIAASVYDNKVLLQANPEYLANLMALSRVERERLLGGNWKVRKSAGSLFKRSEVAVLDVLPTDVLAWVRAWDLAATEPSEVNPDPDWTAGLLMGRRRNGRFVVADLVHERMRAHKVRELIRSTASRDGIAVRVRMPQDPGQAGKDQAASLVSMLSGHMAATERVSGDKVTRAEPFSAQWQAGNVDVLRAPWNDALLNELEAFPGGAHDDIVDAGSDAFAELQGDAVKRFLALAS